MIISPVFTPIVKRPIKNIIYYAAFVLPQQTITNFVQSHISQHFTYNIVDKIAVDGWIHKESICVEKSFSPSDPLFLSSQPSIWSIFLIFFFIFFLFSAIKSFCIHAGSGQNITTTFWQTTSKIQNARWQQILIKVIPTNSQMSWNGDFVHRQRPNVKWMDSFDPGKQHQIGFDCSVVNVPWNTCNSSRDQVQYTSDEFCTHFYVLV